jgi:hypothetical protein
VQKLHGEGISWNEVSPNYGTVCFLNERAKGDKAIYGI